MSARPNTPSDAPAAELAELVEGLVARVKARDAADLDALLRDHPEHAEELRQLLPAVRVMADLSRPGTTDSAGPGGTPLGEELGDYRLLREVGRGGMGVVYEAEQRSLRRRVALKMLPWAAALDPKQLQRFKNEALAAASLKHEHIVQVYAVGCERGVHYYAMEFVEGQTLAQLIHALHAPGPASGERPPPGPATIGYESGNPGADAPRSPAPTAPVAALSTERSGLRDKGFFRTAAGLVAQAADALEHAHGLGIVHRDVKPANLLLDGAGKLYVSDFGLARFGPDAGLTASGDLLGTLRYMAPEQTLARHGLADHRADIYALGATLYELLTGHPAVDAAERAAILRQIAFEDPTTPRKRDKSIPAELEVITMKCLAKNPAERYATAGELADDLRRFRAGEPITARRVGRAERLARWARRNPVVATLTAAVFVLLATVAVGSAVMAAQIEQKADEAQAKAEAEAEARQAADKANAALRATEDRLRRTLYAWQINLIQAAREANKFARASELLNEVRPAAGEPDVRHWEWHFLHRRLHAERLAMPLPGDGRIYEFAGDGSLVAARAGMRQDATTIKLYDTATGRELRAIDFPTRPSEMRLAVSADGKRLAATPGPISAGGPYPLHVWDTATGRKIFSGPTWARPLSDVAFSPDGRRLLTVEYEPLPDDQPTRERRPKTRVWDLEAGKELAVLPAWNPRFSLNGERVAGVTGPNEAAVVKVWDVATGREPLALDLPLSGVGELAFSPDGRQIAAATIIKTGDDWKPGVAVWDAATGLRRFTLTMPGRAEVETGAGWISFWGQPDGLEYTADSRRLVAAAWLDKSQGPVTVAVWDALSGQRDLTLTDGGPRREPTGWDGRHPRQLAVSRDGTRIACGDGTGAVTIWDATTGQRWRELTGHNLAVLRLAFTPDGRSLVTAGRDYQVRVWDVTGQDDAPVTFPWRPASGATRGSGQTVTLSPDGNRVAAMRRREGGGYDVAVWNAADRREVFAASVPGPETGNYRHEMAFSRDGLRLATTQTPPAQGPPGQGPIPDTEIKVWDLAVGRELRTVRRNVAHWSYQSTTICLSPDGTYLALMTNPGQAGVRVVETATGREVWAGTGVGGVAYSPDGQLRVLGTSVGGVAYSPDGQLLAVANKLLDAATGQEQADITRVNAAGDRLPRISRLVSNITSVFSPDGRRLARAVSDSEFQTTRIIVWDADTGKELSSVGGIGSFSHIAYSPDGRRLAAYGHGKVKVWDTDTGRELLTVPTRINVNAGSLAFRPDGHKLIVAGTHDGRPAIEVLDGTPR